MASNVTSEQETGAGLFFINMDKLKNNLRKTRKFLEEIIDIDYGLIDKLRSKEILNIREVEDISARATFIRRNSELLDIIAKKKKISELCDALRETGQQHIVNYLNACGEHRPEFGLDWPLTELENKILNGNQEVLVDSLDTNEFLPNLYEQQVINMRQRKFLDDEPHSNKRNEALLGMIRRSSIHSYRILSDCFRKSKQDFIANTLEKGGVIVRAHLTLECGNVDAVEESIVEEMTRLLVKNDVSKAQARRLLAATQLKIEAVEKGQSIILYVICVNEGEFIRLCNIIDDLKTRDVLQQLFNYLVPKANIKIISMTILEKDIKKAMKSFENEEPMEMRTEKSISEETKEEEFPQESEDPSTYASAEDEKQEDMEQQLVESRMHRESENYAFHNARMDWEKETDSYEKLRMDWEKEKKELIRSLHMLQTDLKKEKDSHEKSRMEWEEEKKELIRSLSKSGKDSVDHEERSAEHRSQTKMENLPLEMLDKILLKTVRRMMVINSPEAFKSFDELMYQVLNHLRAISCLWDSRLRETNWVKIQLQSLRNTSKERDHKTRKSILDCYAIFVKDFELSTVRVSLVLFKVVKREKLDDIFIKDSNSQSRCRAFLDHLFNEGHPLAFIAMQQLLNGNKADILDYMDGRKTCTMTEEGSLFLSNDEIKAIVSTKNINDLLMADMDSDRLGDWLKQERIITIKEWHENIASSMTIKDRRHSTLDYLSTISHPRAYIILRQVLIQDNPNIASAIENATSETEKQYDILNQIIKHREFLMDRMDSECGLLRSIRANGILTNEEFEEIETEATYRRINGRILDCISMNSSRNTADLFIEALKETDQGHLVNYMISDGVYDEKFADEWPLTETEIWSIDSNYEALVDLLHVDTDALLKMLYESDAINNRQRKFISSKTSSRKRNESFLEILRKTSLRNYKKTILCLRKSNQNHIAKILETDQDYDIQKMENQREKLVELIDSQFGLLEKLLKMHAITRKQVEQILCEPTRIRINEMMLDYIFQANKHKYLITALSESSQSHVVNWIKSEGEYSEEFGLDWPLTESQQNILDDNLEQLIDIIDNCELMSMLYFEQVINKRQRYFLLSKITEYEKNEELFGMVRRFSQRSYATFINCLRKSYQGHIANILENGGAIVPVHATVETDNLNETEAQIIDEMTNLLTNMSPEQANRLLASTQLKIIAARGGR